MKIIHSRCAGMDASKRDAKVCVRIAGTGCRKAVDVGSRQHLIIAVGSACRHRTSGELWYRDLSYRSVACTRSLRQLPVRVAHPPAALFSVPHRT
jgi:hypothetical protein